jgi:hypothetical protein
MLTCQRCIFSIGKIQDGSCDALAAVVGYFAATLRCSSVKFRGNTVSKKWTRIPLAFAGNAEVRWSYSIID